MLRLHRGIGERIWITAGDEQIIIEVAGMKKNGRVDLEFSASQNVQIDREERRLQQMAERGV